MVFFLLSIVALVAGYFVYGAIVERIVGVDDRRETPAVTQADGIDYVPMPTWKVFLIQFLNIAGVGPIFGAIMGVQYGPAAFLWIVLGTIFAGAVHDFVSGMISVRLGGMSLPSIVGEQLGKPIERVMAVFTLFLLIMVVAVFVVTPADILADMTKGGIRLPWGLTGEEGIVIGVGAWSAVIFVYYILATLLPIDKLIGNLYPVFGGALLFMAVGLICYMTINWVDVPLGLDEGLGDRMPDPVMSPIFPMMFVSIACGAISGFHATQSPMMARCLRRERHGRAVFYGAMVAEGIVALVWATAAIVYCGGYGIGAELQGGSPAVIVKEVCSGWLGTVGGILAILGVVAAPITTGDTALRSARLIIADMLKVGQKQIFKRLAVALPIVAVTFMLMQVDFQVLWRYFGWGNQSLSIFTLWACSVYLLKQGRRWGTLITVVPAVFMTVVCVTFILFAPTGAAGSVGLPYWAALTIGCAVAALFLGLYLRGVKRAVSSTAERR